LESQGGDVEAAIEAVLRMNDEGEGQQVHSSSRPGSSALAGPEILNFDRDAQVRSDEVIARHLQEQFISETLQEQTPTCFTPITGEDLLLCLLVSVLNHPC